MKRQQRFLTVLLALALLLGMAALPASAQASVTVAAETALSTEDKANALHELGLLDGTGTKADGSPDYNLEGSATRSQGSTMLVYLLGKRSKAAAQYTAGSISSPLEDLESWAAPYVTWLYVNGLVDGTSATTFTGGRSMEAYEFATLILRALGYDNSDFHYTQALSFAVQKQVITQAQSAEFEAKFRRDGLIEMSYNAMYCTMKDSSQTLLEKLTADGIFKSSYKNNTSVASTRALTLTQKYSGGGLDGLVYPEEQTQGNSVCCADIDGDGNPEIIFGVQSVFCVNAATGKLKWKTTSSELGGGWFRDTRAPLQVLDWDKDGDLEVFSMTFSNNIGYVNIIGKSGTIEKQWTINTGYQIRAAHPADLDGDGQYELIVGMGVGGSGAPSVYVYNNDGTVRSGWPQVLGYGLYSNSITTADLDRDGMQEIIITYDDTQIAAFRADGTKVEAASFGATWDKIDFFANYDAVGYNSSSLTTSDLRNGLMGTYSGLVTADLGDGTGTKIVGVALINNVKVTSDNMSGGYTSVNSFAGSAQYFAPFIIDLTRNRYVNTSRGYDWSSIPADTGDIYTLNGEVLSNPGTEVSIIDPDYRPVVADLDGDGVKEILYTANDGRVHCFSLDGTEHGAWPFALNSRATSVPNYIRYASRPAVADINGDGKLEVIFATYSTRSQTSERGKLYVLDYTGKKLAEATLPPLFGRTTDAGAYANGSNVTPVVADIDKDGKMEIVVMTFSCGLVAYEIS